MRPAHQAPDALEVQRPIGVPFGEQHQNVRAFGDMIGAVAPQHVGKLRAGDRHAFRIVGADAGAGRLQRRDDGQRRRVAHVVRVGLEGHAEKADRLAGHLAAERGRDAFGHGALAGVVGVDRRLDDESGAPAARAVSSSAVVSLGKHEPP